MSLGSPLYYFNEHSSNHGRKCACPSTGEQDQANEKRLVPSLEKLTQGSCCTQVTLLSHERSHSPKAQSSRVAPGIALTQVNSTIFTADKIALTVTRH